MTRSNDFTWNLAFRTLFVALFLALFLAPGVSCQSVPSGGSFNLSIGSTQNVDRVKIKAFDISANETEVSFATGGHDLSQSPLSGDVDSGNNLHGPAILLVAFGYVGTNTGWTVTGRAIGQLSPGKRVPVSINMVANIVDDDEDGYAVTEDCNDHNSKQSPFFSEVCGNDIDDNCDGSVDENCPCVAGGSRACYSSLDQTTRHMGVCSDGQQTCRDGIWGACTGSVLPSTELCDGLDNNCNGTVDEGCPCNGASQRYCYNDQVAAAGAPASAITVLGECRVGSQLCNSSNSTWGLCTGAVYPVTELCDGLDNDCDGVFDNGYDHDGDGYTVCGTNNGSCGSPKTGGLNPMLADCDDANAARHPCAVDRCDQDFDADCDNAPLGCSPAKTCQAAGYYGGWQTDPNGRQQALCAYAQGTFSQCQADGQCSAASVVCASGAIGSLTGSVRSICTSPDGCEAGSTNPPAPLSAPVVAAHSDPFGDCGLPDCNAVFAGTTANTGTGWVYNSTDKNYECHVFADAGNASSGCNGAGGCETSWVACQYIDSVGPVSSDANAVLGACLVPFGASGVGDADLGSTCVTDTSGNSTPPDVTALSAVLDPHNRCPVTPANNTECQGIVAAPGWSVSGVCTYYKSGTVTQLGCVGGACGSVASGGCDGQLAGTLTKAQAASCDPNCEIASACVTGTMQASPFCLNALAPVGPSGMTGKCPTGDTCVGASGDATGNGAQCSVCDTNLYCGSSCQNCGSAGVCCQGGGSVGADCVQGADTTTASNNGCQCGVVSGATLAMWCSAGGGSCCAAGSYCDAGVCTAPTGPAFACGSTTCSDPTTQYCDITHIPYACVTNSNPCNQTTCSSSQTCLAAAFTNSTCQECNGHGGAGCGVGCQTCSGAQTCKEISGGTACKVSDTGSACSCQ